MPVSGPHVITESNVGSLASAKLDLVQVAQPSFSFTVPKIQTL